MKRAAFLLPFLCALANAQERGYPPERPITAPCNLAEGSKQEYGYVALTLGIATKIHGAPKRYLVTFGFEGDEKISCEWNVFQQQSFRNSNTPTGEFHEFRQDFVTNEGEYGLFVFKLPVGKFYLIGAQVSNVVVVPYKTFVGGFSMRLRTREFKVASVVERNKLTYLGSVNGSSVMRNPDAWFKISDSALSIESQPERDLGHLRAKFVELASVDAIVQPADQLPKGAFKLH